MKAPICQILFYVRTANTILLITPFILQFGLAMMRKALFSVLAFTLYLIFPIVYPFPGDKNNLKAVNQIQTQSGESESEIQLPPASHWFGSDRLSFKHGHQRHRRYVLHGSRWKVNPVSYNISKYPPSHVLSNEIVDREIDAAFRMWEDVSNLTFRRAWEGKVNIDIRFESRGHGDEEPFDGKGGMTAHAYYPYYGGNIHFDADEMWTSGSNLGINLFQVASHEIGHALGLEHTDVPDRTVMSPYYLNYDENFRMHRDDIEGIQKLYGKKSYSVCDHSKIDAAVTMVDGSTYLFKGNLVYKMKNFSSPADPDYPKEISKVFESLHGPLDAALTRSNGVTYFFKGDEFWRFTNMSLDIGFPKKVSDFFPNIPTPLDAAVVFPQDDNIYFFKGRNYWQYDARKSPPVSTDYPRSISEWKGIPTNIDAAVRLKENGQLVVYFFKEHQYWKFNDRSNSVYITDPPYPRNIRPLVNGCDSHRRRI